MVRNSKRTYRNSRNGKQFLPYQSYSSEDLENAIKEVQERTLSVGMAAKKYNVPKSTVSRRYRMKNTTQDTAGHPTLFTKVEEDCFIEHILAVSEWGFPFDTLDLRIFAQKYLNKLGRTDYKLKDNMPGVDWALNFLKRHKNRLSNRYAANISTDRAKVTGQTIDTFFEHYTNTIEGVAPDCLINYDETNLTDDPGNKRYIYKRGTKYPERVVNSSKAAISLMFAGTASGHNLPVYVVYKSEHLWDQWVEGGPEQSRYGRSKSGWFDGITFEDWFNSIVVHYVKTKCGQKVVVLGDNLSSHFSQRILETCEKLNISFVCLPPKATHLMQPLDVAFYAPLKHYWRDILTEWKRKEGRRHKTLTKSAFPRLLTKLTNKLMENGAASTNIISGFEKCGLYPVNPDRPKSRLPQFSKENESVASEVIMDMLQDMRGVSETTEITKRKKKIAVPAGKSISAKDLEPKEVSENHKRKKQKTEQGKVKGIEKVKVKGKGKGKGKTSKPKENSESSDMDADILNSLIMDTTIARKTNRLRSSSTTSVSDTISIHSDSDIQNIELDETEDSDLNSNASNICADVTNMPFEFQEQDDLEMAGPSNIYLMKETPGPEPDDHCDVEVPYCVNDNVIVRYWSRKSWKYYVGIVDDVKGQQFRIQFYKTVRKPELKFIMPKKIDHDVVPFISIVKKVELQQKTNQKEFVLIGDENHVYF